MFQPHQVRTAVEGIVQLVPPSSCDTSDVEAIAAMVVEVLRILAPAVVFALVSGRHRSEGRKVISFAGRLVERQGQPVGPSVLGRGPRKKRRSSALGEAHQEDAGLVEDQEGTTQ